VSTIEFPPAERVSLVGDFTRGELIGAGSATAVFGVGAMGGRLLAAIVVSAAILAWTFAPTRRRPMRIIVPAALRWRLRRDRTWSATIRPSASPPQLPSFLRGVDLEVVNGLDGSPVGVVANRDSYTVMFEVSRPALTYVSPAEQTHALAEWGEVLTGLCVERNSELVAERVGWTDVHRAADPAALQRHHVERGVAGPATADYEDYLGRFGTLAAHHEVVVWATVTRPGRFRVAKRLGLSGSPGEVMCAAAVHAGEALRTELAGRRFTTSPLWTPAQIGRSVTRALDPYGPLEALSGNVKQFWPQCDVLIWPHLVGVGSWFAASGGAGAAEAVAVVAGLDDVGVEGEPVNDGGDEAGVGDDVAPFAEWQVGGDGDRVFLFAFGDDLEQQFGAAGVELDVAELVEAEQIEASVAGDESGEFAVVGGFDEFVDELGGGDVADSSALLAGGDAESDEEVGLAGS
jgi:hypothetical protein